MTTALDVLQNKFGYEQFRNSQEEIINTVLGRKDTFVLMPTGGGKSLCYQIPALLFPGLTIVISPLIALMKDQVDALNLNGISAAYLNSSQDIYERDEVFDNLRRKKTKLLYIAPERLFNNEQQFISFLQELHVSLIAIDEAHCISAWGHDFRPEYRMLAQLKKFFPSTPTIALTATADELTRKDIVEKLQLKNPSTFVSSFNRNNIFYSVEPKKKVYEKLVQYLQKHRAESGIIYALSRQSTEKLAKDLERDGFLAKPYHAGLSQNVRAKNQELFVKDKIKIMVATIAFGMGINKSNVRFVIHVDLPKNIESYYQETGRAGRDGLKSEAILFYSGGDVNKLKNFATIEDNPEQTRIMLHKLSQMADLCETHGCRRQKMLNYFGEDFNGPCNGCDTCLTEFEKVDGTILAQKALSAVARLENKYGLTYVVDFLRGSKSEKIRPHHKEIKTYGIGANTSKEEWIRCIKDLITQRYLEQSGAEYPVLKLTEKSVPVLKGTEQVWFTKTVYKKKTEDDTLPYKRDLFAELKALRTQLAQAADVPAYLIFSDATLIELATYLPLNLNDIRAISGFGEKKTAEFGEKFLSIIVAYCQKRSLATNIAAKAPKRGYTR